MSENVLPAHVRLLAERHLPSARHLHALVLLWSGVDLTTADVAASLQVADHAAAAVMDDFLRTGLAERAGDGIRKTTDQTAHAEGDALLDANGRFPVQLIRAIYEAPRPSPVQSFADAFRLRKT